MRAKPVRASLAAAFNSARRVPQLLVAVATVLVSGSEAGADPFAYIANLASHTVSVIDLSTHALVDTIAVPGGPLGVAVSPDGSRVYVGNASPGNSVSVIDAATNAIVADIVVGPVPLGVVAQS